MNYDEIGKGYALARRADARIFAQIDRALGDANSLVNVGAGAGSYEPADRRVVAVEPSSEMISQRSPGSAPAVRGGATDLPFGDDAFEAAMAILTVHHWPDRIAGLRELRRVASKRVVILTHDTALLDEFWLTRDYFPTVSWLDSNNFPSFTEIAEVIGRLHVQTVPVPLDCSDGFLGAYYGRPEAYLDPAVRAGISCFPALGPAVVDEGIARLSDDLATGRWDALYGSHRLLGEIDLGYRLLIAED